MPPRDANIAELPKPQASQPDDNTTGWDRWLRGHLDIEFSKLHRALGQLLAEERHKFSVKASALDLKLAKLSGAVDVLRGAQPPRPRNFRASRLGKRTPFTTKVTSLPSLAVLIKRSVIRRAHRARGIGHVSLLPARGSQCVARMMAMRHTSISMSS